MSEAEQLPKSQRSHWWRILLAVIVLGLAVNLLLPQIAELERSWDVVKNLIWWAVGLSILAQALSYVFAGYMIHAILETTEQKISLWKCILIYMASFSVGLVTGGWVGSAAATVGWVKQENKDGHTALLAGSLPALLINASLIGLAFFGILYLLFVHNLTKGQLIQYLVILFILGLLTFGELAAMRFPRQASKALIWFIGRLARLFHRPFDPEKITSKIDHFAEVWHALGRKWLRPLIGALGYIACDMLTLFLFFLAAGYQLNPGVLLAGYSLPVILSKVAFIFPGGVGLVEVTMVAMFDSLKVPDAISVIAVLGYRLFSFWIPTILGFIVAAFLSRKSFKQSAKQILHITNNQAQNKQD